MSIYSSGGNGNRRSNITVEEEEQCLCIFHNFYIYMERNLPSIYNSTKTSHPNRHVIHLSGIAAIASISIKKAPGNFPTSTAVLAGLGVGSIAA
jgi:hypothetical protein